MSVRSITDTGQRASLVRATAESTRSGPGRVLGFLWRISISHPVAEWTQWTERPERRQAFCPLCPFCHVSPSSPNAFGLIR